MLRLLLWLCSFVFNLRQGTHGTASQGFPVDFLGRIVPLQNLGTKWITENNQTPKLPVFTSAWSHSIVWTVLLIWLQLQFSFFVDKKIMRVPERKYCSWMRMLWLRKGGEKWNPFICVTFCKKSKAILFSWSTRTAYLMVWSELCMWMNCLSAFKNFQMPSCLRCTKAGRSSKC